MKVPRTVGYWVALLVLAGAFAAAMRPRPVSVEVGTLTRGPMTVTADEEGRTRVRERFVVASPVSGRVQRMELHEGDAIAAGDVVARVAPAPLDVRSAGQAEARLKAAQAAHEAAVANETRARAHFEQTHRERERVDELKRTSLVSTEEHERATVAEVTAAAELDAARHSTRAAQQEVAEARAVLVATPSDGRRPPPLVAVRSPVAGTLLRVLQESDRVVAAGTPLFETGDLNQIEIVVELLSSEAVRVRPGATVWIDGWGGASTLDARVRRVEPAGFTKYSALGVEEQRVNVIADFVACPEGLGDGYRVEARIAIWESPNALKVPGSALFRTGSEWRAFVIDAGRARSRAVEVGQRNTTEAEVVSGLNEGDRVVLYPGDRVQEGQRVVAR